MKRGDLVTVVLAGDYGKPRPALIVQADAFAALPSATLLPMTSEIHKEHLLRITVKPNRANGLQRPSQVMIDKTTTVPRQKIGQRIGRLDAATLETVSKALARFLGL